MEPPTTRPTLKASEFPVRNFLLDTLDDVVGDAVIAAENEGRDQA